jgi:hypothetical protein
MHRSLVSLMTLALVPLATAQPVAKQYFRISAFGPSPSTEDVNPVGATLLPTGSNLGADIFIAGRSATTGQLTFNGYFATTGNFRWNQPGAVVAPTSGNSTYAVRGPGGRVAVVYNNGVGMGIADMVIECRNGAGTLLYRLTDNLLPGFSTLGGKATFDGSGNLYVGGTTSGPGGMRAFVAKYSAAGVRQWFVEPGLARTGDPTVCAGINIPPAGRIWAAFNHNSRAHVWQLDDAGTTLFGSAYSIDSVATETAQTGISNGRFYVVGYVYRTGARDIFVRQYVTNAAWYTTRYGIAGDVTMTVAGTAADIPGNIYALMRISGIQSSLLKVDRSGTQVWTRVTGLTEPTDLQIDEFGETYSMGQRNSTTLQTRIQKYGPDGTLRWDEWSAFDVYRGLQLLVDRPSGALVVLHKVPFGFAPRLNFTRLLQAPVANNDASRARRNIAQPVSIAANDRYVSGASLSIVTLPAHGSVAIDAEGRIVYTSTGSFTGTDTFQYRWSRGGVSNSTATVTMTVTP